MRLWEDEMIEIWYSTGEGEACSLDDLDQGWYWWHCWPGCLPDCDPIGPFASEEEARLDASRDEILDGLHSLGVGRPA